MTGQPDRHGWMNWSHYESIQDRRLRDFDSFIVENNLIAAPTAREVLWNGRLICQDRFELSVSRQRRP